MVRAKASAYPRLWDRTGTMVAVLKDAYDVIITDAMILGDSGGQETLEFKLPFKSDQRALIRNEMVIECGGSRFEVRTPWDGWDQGSPTPIGSFRCEAYWYDLAEKDPVIIDTPITDAATALDTILAGTGWTVDVCEPTAGSIQVIEPSSPLALLRLLPRAFGGELVFDNVAKTVSLVNRRGSVDPVALYAHGRNLVGNARQIDTTNLVSRLYPYGSSGGSVDGVGTNGVPLDISSRNGGLPYLEDYSFYDDNGWPHTVRAAVIVADNIMDPDTLKTWGQQQLSQLSKPAYTYTIQQSNTGDNDAEPALGDTVRIHDDDLDIDVMARVQSRIRNILQPEQTKYVIDTALYTLSQALVSSGGGGAVTPPDTGIGDSLAPKAPTSASISQEGVTGTGGAMQASETLSWTAVTQNEDNSAITDLAGYQIRYAVGAGSWHYQDAPFPDTSAWLGLFQPDKALSAQVRAYDSSGNYSAWTAAGGVTTTDDDEAPNAPSAPTIDVTTLPGIMRVHWDGLDAGGLPMPDDLAYVEVHASTSATAVADDTNLVDTLLTAGYSDLATAYGVNTYIWFVAMDVNHNVSGPSTKSVGATRKLVDTDIIDAAITNAKIATDAVTADKLSAGSLGTDLILNGGFEDDVSDGINRLSTDEATLEGGLAGWAGGNANSTVARQNAVVLDGSWSLSLTAVAAGNVNAFPGSYSVVPGKKYTAIAHIQAASVGRPVQLSIWWLNAAGGLISSTGSSVANDVVGSPIKAVCTGVAPAGAVTAVPIVFVTAPAAGEAHYIDKISFAGGDSADFKYPPIAGTTRVVAAGWVAGAGVATYRPASNNRSGSFCAQWAASGSPGLVSDAFPVAAGDVIAFSAWAKTDVARASGLYLRISWRDASNNQISISDAVNNVATTTAYAEYSGQTSAAPAGTVSAVAQIFGTFASTTYYLDDISIRKVIKSNAIADAAIISAKIADLAVGTAKIADAAIVTAKIGDAQIVSAKIGSLQVNDAHIANMSVGKITAGILSADVTVSARVKTADFGARAEMNSTGFHVFNSGGTEVGTMGIVGGVPSLQIIGGTIIGGTYKSAASGARIEISSTGGFDTIAFYTATGTTPNYIGNMGGDVIVLNPATGALFFVGTISGPFFNGTQGIFQPSGQNAVFGSTVVQGNLTVSGGAIFPGGSIAMGGNQITGSGEIHLGSGASITSDSYANYPTTASAANMFMGTGGRMSRSTASSRRYKKNIKPLALAESERLLDIQAVQFQYKASYHPGNERMWGAIAEDVDALGLTHLVSYREDDGQPENVNYDRIAISLLPVIQDHRARIEALERRLEKVS